MECPTLGVGLREREGCCPTGGEGSSLLCIIHLIQSDRVKGSETPDSPWAVVLANGHKIRISAYVLPGT